MPSLWATWPARLAPATASRARPPSLAREFAKSVSRHIRLVLVEGLFEANSIAVRDACGTSRRGSRPGGGFFSAFRGRGPRQEKAGERESGSRQELRALLQT